MTIINSVRYKHGLINITTTIVTLLVFHWHTSLSSAKDFSLISDEAESLGYHFTSGQDKPSNKGCAAGIIVAGSIDGTLFAFDAWTGKVKWNYHSGGPLVMSSTFQNLNSENVYNSKEASDSCDSSQVFVPSLDGRIFSISKHGHGSIEPLKLTAKDLANSHLPRKSTRADLANAFLIGQKQVKLFGIDIDSGEGYRVGSNSPSSSFSSEKKSMMAQSIFYPPKENRRLVYFGRSEYTSQAIHASNGSVVWSITIGEFFVHSETHGQCPTYNPDAILENEKSIHYPILELKTQDVTKSQSIVSARHPETGALLWKWEIPGLIVSVHGLTSSGIVFHEISIPGPSSSPSPSSSSSSNLPLVFHESSIEKAIVNPPDKQVVSVKTYRKHEAFPIHMIGNQLYILPKINNPPTNNVELPKSKEKQKISAKTIPFPFGPKELYTPISERTYITSHGLFVSWRFVFFSLIGMMIIVIIVAFYFFRKGKKMSVLQESYDRVIKTRFPWLQSNQSPTLSMRIQEDANKEKENQGPNIAPISADLERRSSIRVAKYLSLHRSNSLSALEGVISLQSQAKICNDFTNAEKKNNRNDNFFISHRHSPFTKANTKGSISNGLPPRPNDKEKINHDKVLTTKFWESKDTFHSNITSSTLTSMNNSTNPADSEKESSLDLPFVSTFRFMKEFERICNLGKGGFGQVVLARNRLDGRKYAIKRIGLSISNQSKGSLRKVLREVKILALLDHPNIVRYYQAWLEEISKNELNGLENEGQDYIESMDTHDNKNISSGMDSGSLSEVCPPLDDDDVVVFEENEYHEDKGDGFTWDRNDQMVDDFDNLSIASGNTTTSTNISNEKKKKEEKNKQTNNNNNNYNNVYKKQTSKKYCLDHWLYIQMQFCSKKSLGDFLESKERKVEIHQVLHLFQQIVSALAHVHSCGLIHRDLKPANIFIMDDQYETIKLGDFGLSRYVGTQRNTLSSLRNTHMDISFQASFHANANTAGVGTYLYASPEQINGQHYDAKTDMYSIGIILFELCNHPFDTLMERSFTMQQARTNLSEMNWDFQYQHPHVYQLITQLLSNDLHLRPSAVQVVEWCKETLLSFGKKYPSVQQQ